MTTSDKLREMNSTDALREFLEKIWYSPYRTVDRVMPDLTALISEHYTERAKYDEAVRQRDELREALKQIRDTAIFVRRGSMDAYKMQHTAEAAIKSTER